MFPEPSTQDLWDRFIYWSGDPKICWSLHLSSFLVLLWFLEFSTFAVKRGFFGEVWFITDITEYKDEIQKFGVLLSSVRQLLDTINMRWLLMSSFFVMFVMHYVMFVIVVIHKYWSWVELLISPYLCHIAKYSWARWEESYMQEAFILDPARII